MPAWLPALIGLQFSNKISKSLHIQALDFRMLSQFGSTKRPTCPSCSKPTRVCLCDRFRTPRLDNSVAVTVLQHSLEKKHPLNSARIATLGFKNVDVITVWDVNIPARFSIQLLDANCSVDRVELSDAPQVFDKMPSERADVLDFTVEKHGAMISSLVNLKTSPDKSQDITSFDQLMASDITVDRVREGFIVKKHKNEEHEEFKIAIPPGSVLLFPSELSVDIDDVDFEYKNLIVLDGTWPKAKRMYNENPWLRLLPHVSLNLDNKSSLYGEVRLQPREGCFSTIESIVYAMKTVGKEEDDEGLDGLLDVFESMVVDQRRCKFERLSKAS